MRVRRHEYVYSVRKTEGREEGKREKIFAFLKAGAELRVIKEASGLSEEEIEKLWKEMKE